MNADVELDTWRLLWQAREPVVPDVKALVERETRRMRRFVAAEIAITTALGYAMGKAIAYSYRTTFMPEYLKVFCISNRLDSILKAACKFVLRK